MKICAVVVTYNRKKELNKQIVEVITNQTMKVDAYYIIDNCSSDNTEQMIKNYTTPIIKYLKTEENLGGAGGFSFGLKCAYRDGYDWYILMDDDGRPINSECFQNMYNHIVEKKYDASGLYLLNSLVASDERYLSFGLDHAETINEITSMVKEKEIANKINPFNGTWISNGLIKEIGFPNGLFFIKGDENDYFRRAIAVGAHVATVVDSVYFHPRLGEYEKKRVFGKEMYVYIEAPWKEYYSTRNYTYSFCQLGQTKKAIVFCVKRMYCCVVCKCDKKSVIRMIIAGFLDGIKGRLGSRIRP